MLEPETIPVVEEVAATGARCVVVTGSALAPVPPTETVRAIVARHNGLSVNSNVSAVALDEPTVIPMADPRTEREATFARELTVRFQRGRVRRT